MRLLSQNENCVNLVKQFKMKSGAKWKVKKS